MENEELAALRASLLNAQQLPPSAREREARLSATLGDGDELVPYVLARSCSDPRDRRVRDELRQYRVLEGGFDPSPAMPRSLRAPRYEPPPVQPGWVVAILLATALVWLLLRGIVELLMFR